MFNKRTSIIWTLNKKELEKVVKQNNSFAGLIRYFGFTYSGSMIKIFKKRFAEDNIDYSHFKLGVNCNKGRKFPNIQKGFTLKEIMTKNSNYCRTHLKRRLLKEELIENKCQICGQIPEWKGKKMVLILDHINGINNDNRLENLRMVCPNCNSQLPTHCGRHKRKKNNCKRCGCIISKNATYCRNCHNKSLERTSIRKVKNRPTKEELEQMIQTMPMTKIGTKYGVSDNAIRKWCKSYGIEVGNRRGYWSKQNQCV